MDCKIQQRTFVVIVIDLEFSLSSTLDPKHVKLFEVHCHVGSEYHLYHVVPDLAILTIVAVLKNVTSVFLHNAERRSKVVIFQHRLNKHVLNTTNEE